MLGLAEQHGFDDLAKEIRVSAEGSINTLAPNRTGLQVEAVGAEFPLAASLAAIADFSQEIEQFRQAGFKEAAYEYSQLWEQQLHYLADLRRDLNRTLMQSVVSTQGTSDTEYIESRPPAPGLDPDKLRENSPNLAEVVNLVRELARQAQEVDVALVEILRLWIECADKPSIRERFADAARFLRVAAVGAQEVGRSDAPGGV